MLHPPNVSRRKGAAVLGSFIDALTWDETTEQISRWASESHSRTVCICNVHVVVSASRSKALLDAVNGADMATPDGFPIALSLRALRFPNQQRIAGPDLMWKLCLLAERTNQRIFLYGSTPDVLALLQKRLAWSFPRLKVAGAISPPFRSLTDEEQTAFNEFINASKPNIVFVGLGCPKQELWMHNQKGRVHAVMVGVGAAFDFHAGAARRAPLWMQRCGLEWLHRLASDPKRLWKRYLVTNSVFVARMTVQLFRSRLL
jgi:N-acetylglucosaminyldiphosphoundecaprenol N-acetyl-beta-D-mannosaminyltransferase